MSIDMAEQLKADLKKRYIGKNLRDVPTPSAVLDINLARQNCEQLLEACRQLKFGFRAHVKTHKTVELTMLQVGDWPSANLIVSTLVEAELVAPFLLECRKDGRPVNVLYGLPAPPSQIESWAKIAGKLGEGSVTLMVDHPGQLAGVKKFKEFSGGIVPKVFVKIDMGGRRAGVNAGSETLEVLAAELLEGQRAGLLEVLGLYSHAGHSYGGNDAAAAMGMLRQELDALVEGAKHFKGFDGPLVVSVGASPTAMSIANLVPGSAAEKSRTDAGTSAAQALQDTFTKIADNNLLIEVHAGVYPTFDLQQVAAHALSAPSHAWSKIAVTILTEVISLYPGRGDNGSSEALVSAGCLALGRESCKAYAGMGILTPWNIPGMKPLEDYGSIEEHDGWQVVRMSQEHGILGWKAGGGDRKEGMDSLLDIGQKVRIFPNHACISLSGFHHILAVDSSKTGEEDIIQDVWISASGW